MSSATFIPHATSNLALGVVTPIPVSPAEVIRIRSEPPLNILILLAPLDALLKIVSPPEVEIAV